MTFVSGEAAVGVGIEIVPSLDLGVTLRFRSPGSGRRFQRCSEPSWCPPRQHLAARAGRAAALD